MILHIHTEYGRRRPSRYGQGEVRTKNLRMSPSKEWDGYVFDSAHVLEEEAANKMIHYQFIKFVAFNIFKAKHHLDDDYEVVYDYNNPAYRSKYARLCGLGDNEDIKEEMYKNQVVCVGEAFKGSCVKDIYATRGNPKITVEFEDGIKLKFSRERFAEMKRTAACARKW